MWKKDQKFKERIRQKRVKKDKKGKSKKKHNNSFYLFALISPNLDTL